MEERESSPDYEIYEYGSPEELDAESRGVGELRLAPGVSLPSTPPDDETLARHPHAETLRDLTTARRRGLLAFSVRPRPLITARYDPHIRRQHSGARSRFEVLNQP